MNSIGKVLIASVAGLGLLAGAAQAQERGTKDEAKALAESAASHAAKAGVETACKDFAADKNKWKPKDMYVFIVNFDGMMVCHGANEKLAGKDMRNLKDPNGKAMTEAMIETASGKGSGWVDYEWPHPQTKKIESKTTYVKKIADYKGYVGVGVYR